MKKKYGRAAVENVIRSICGLERPLAPLPKSYPESSFMQDARHALAGVGLIVLDTSNPGQAWPDKDFSQINRFLNRLLGCPVLLQNAIFQFFSDVMAAVILEAKRSGRWDLGILDLGSSGSDQEAPTLVDTRLFELANLEDSSITTTCSSNSSKRVVEMHTVLVERGLDWERASAIYESSRQKGLSAGFYLSNVQVTK